MSIQYVTGDFFFLILVIGYWKKRPNSGLVCSKSLMSLACIFSGQFLTVILLGLFAIHYSLFLGRDLSGRELMVTLLCLRGRKTARNGSSQRIHTPSSYFSSPTLLEGGRGVTVLLRQNTVEFLEVLHLNCNSFLRPPNPSLQSYMHINRKFPVSRAFFSS